MKKSCNEDSMGDEEFDKEYKQFTELLKNCIIDIKNCLHDFSNLDSNYEPHITAHAFFHLGIVFFRAMEVEPDVAFNLFLRAYAENKYLFKQKDIDILLEEIKKEQPNQDSD